MLDPIGFVIAMIVAIIGYRYAAKKQKHRTFDGYTLKKLEDSGVNINEKQALEFWFYGNNKEAVEQLTEQLQQRGYETTINETEDDPQFVVWATKTMVPDLTTMLGLRKEFDKLVKSYRVVYDGWGCRVYAGDANEVNS